MCLESWNFRIKLKCMFLGRGFIFDFVNLVIYFLFFKLEFWGLKGMFDDFVELGGLGGEFRVRSLCDLKKIRGCQHHSVPERSPISVLSGPLAG